ncbi:MAG: ATP-binding protein [Candidatus Sumerlaeaceae bacterium]
MNETKIISPPPQTERRILVVDDEKRMVESLRTLLSSCGYVVDTALGGNEAIQKLAAQDYPVVITDLRMDDADGFEIMRSVGDSRHTAFIIITGHASTESAIQAVHHKAFDYLPKPFEFEQLRKTVERAFAAVEAQRFRKDLISMITHDIKIPLSSIIGYASLIFDKTTGQLNPRAKEFVQTIHSNALKILSLIDNFLTSCKIEGGKLRLFLRQVQLNFLVEDLVCVFQADAERKSLTVTTDLADNLPPVMADENLLFRAVSNVVGNAYKFTPVGGTITILTRFVPATESPLACDKVLVAVTNTGSGIAPEDLPQIFEKYRRSDAHGGIEGSGLGLYITRNIVELHGGAIEVQSTPNELTTFRLYVPLKAKCDAVETEE